MEIKQILEAVAKAYKDFKDAFKYGQTTDSLLENFKNSLKESVIFDLKLIGKWSERYSTPYLPVTIVRY